MDNWRCWATGCHDVWSPVIHQFAGFAQPVLRWEGHGGKGYDASGRNRTGRRQHVILADGLDGQDQRLDRLADEVAELRKLTVSIGERLSRSEGQIEIIREQAETVDAPRRHHRNPRTRPATWHCSLTATTPRRH